MDRILILMQAECYAAADEALRSARDNAASPLRLSYGLSLDLEPDEGEVQAMRALGFVQFICPGGSAWTDAPELWQGEGYMLVAHPDMRFTRHWDMQILRALRQCRSLTDHAVLTGWLPRPQDPVDAVCPVAAQAFDGDGRLCFHRGTPLRYAAAPERSAFLHPDFCFGPQGFFRAMSEAEEPLFLSAYLQKWELFTLHRPLLHMLSDAPILPAAVPSGDDAPTGLGRFESRFSLRFAARQLSPMARMGVFRAELTFPVHVPYAVRAQEALREAAMRRSKARPLCVTAYQALERRSEHLPEQFLCWFGYLKSLKNLTLLCYGDSESVRKLSLRHPNVLEVKRRTMLPVQTAIAPEDELNYLKLSKPFMLARSREKFLEHTHYIWMDFGCLRYPVYERAALDWDAVCTDRIVLATVDGEPDGSMIVVPDARLLTLCREISAICDNSLNAGEGLPRETELWRGLMAAHPDWFTAQEMPGPRELLTLCMMSREEEAHVNV